MTQLSALPFVLGGGPIGSYAAEGDAETGRAAIARALSGGIHRFDVAPSYGDAEALLGATLAELTTSSGAPDVAIDISTKVGRIAMANANPYAHPSGRNAPAGAGAFDFSTGGVRRSLDNSRDRLGRRLNTVFLHDPECAPDLALEQALPELGRQRDAGLIDRIGVATTDPAVAERFAAEREISVVMIAAQWTLTTRTAGRLLDRCLETGIDVLAAAPFDSGLLARHRPDPTAPSGYRQASVAAVERAERLAGVCAGFGVTLPQAALHFPLRHPAVRAVVVGMRSAAEVEDNLKHMTASPPEALWAELDAVLASST